MHFGTNRWRVDVSNSGIEVTHGCEGSVHVLGVKRGRQSVFDAIRDLDSIFEVVARNDRDHRPKDFLLRDAHFGIDVDEHRRLHKITSLIFAFVEPVATALQASALSLADIHIAEIGLELVLVDRWAHLYGFIQTVADLQGFGAFHVAFDEIAVDALLHNDPAGRSATLTSGSKASPQPAFNREIEVGVVEHDHRILAAEFERTMFEALGSGRAHNASHSRRARQRYGSHVGVFREWRADFGSKAGHDVHHASRQAGIIK